MSKYSRYDKCVLSDKVLVKRVRQAAKKYSEYVEKEVLLIFATSRKGPFYTYEFWAGKENFQHLAGIQSPNGAEWFWTRCLDDTELLKREEIVVKRDIKTTSSKIEVLPDVVDLKKAKAYKLGRKDLITLNVEFSVAIGNNQSIMGFDKRKTYLPIPVTVLNRSIYEFCSSAATIYLIMTKNKNEKKYSNIFYEITEDIIHKANFDEEIQNLIDESVLGIPNNEETCVLETNTDTTPHQEVAATTDQSITDHPSSDQD